MASFDFKTISEMSVLSEAQRSLIGKMITSLQYLPTSKWSNEQARYRTFRRLATQYNEINERVLVLEKEAAAGRGRNRTMLMPSNAKNMSSVQVALEVAIHELVTLNNLQVTDNGKDVWQINTREIIALLNEVLKAIKEAAHE